MTGTDATGLTELFETERPRLRGVAYRMLGSMNEADDVVQDAWLRLRRSDTSEVENLRGWLTTVVARLCLDALRARRARREELVGFHLPEPVIAPDGFAPDPEHEALLADSVGLAMLVVLEQLTPPERLAFVLHDVFAVPFDEIAPIVGKTPDAARQLASRARRRVHGASADDAPAPGDVALQRRAVAAFLAAARDGNFEALMATLDPDVEVHTDFGRVRGNAATGVRGRQAVADQAMAFRHNAPGGRLANVNGSPGLVVFAGDRPYAILGFRFQDDLIAEIFILADPDRLKEIDYSVLDA